MDWTIKIEEKAKKELKKLGHQAHEKIINFLKRVKRLSDPRQMGGALSGELKGLWKYRVGDYRIVCNIQDSELIVLVIHTGHRKDVYK